MKHVVVSVFDAATELYGRPVFVSAVGVAVRSFGDEVNRGEGDVGKHPEDFSLFQLGEFDDATGHFSGRVMLLARAENLKEK